MTTAPKKSHRKVFTIGGITAIAMFFFSFAIVPFYSLICKATGLNTSVPSGELLTAYADSAKKPADMTREITVQFSAINHMGMTWDFFPRTKSIKVHPGENAKVLFYAKNTQDRVMTVQAIPSMTPTDAISFFHKIECFCFRQQTLNGRESKEMPLVFQIDRNLPKDIHVITLQYTLYDVTPKTKETRKG